MSPVRMHFTDEHPLAQIASRHCRDPHGPLVGGVACGRCWELAIRDDERVVVEHDLPREQLPDHLLVDEVAIARAIDGQRVWLRPAERRLAIARLLDRGFRCGAIAYRLHTSRTTIVREARLIRGAA